MRLFFARLVNSCRRGSLKTSAPKLLEVGISSSLLRFSVNRSGKTVVEADVDGRGTGRTSGDDSEVIRDCRRRGSVRGGAALGWEAKSGDGCESFGLRAGVPDTDRGGTRRGRTLGLGPVGIAVGASTLRARVICGRFGRL